MIGDAHEVCEAYRLLGGRTGSQDSEKLVFNLLQESTKAPNDLIATVAGEDRYSSAVKLIEKAFVPPAETAIVVPGQSTSPSMIAACLSGLLDAPVFLTSPTALPDITAQAIKRYGPTSIILLGDESLVSTVVERDLMEACGPRAHVQRIDSHDLSFPRAWRLSSRQEVPPVEPNGSAHFRWLHRGAYIHRPLPAHRRRYPCFSLKSQGRLMRRPSRRCKATGSPGCLRLGEKRIRQTKSSPSFRRRASRWCDWPAATRTKPMRW